MSEPDELPAPGDMFASATVDESDKTQMPAHSRATVMRLTYDGGARDVMVHFTYADFTGRGNESFMGRDNATLTEFRQRFPIARGSAR